MSTSIEVYNRNTSYIPTNWRDIRNAYMNKLGEIAKGGEIK